MHIQTLSPKIYAKEQCLLEQSFCKNDAAKRINFSIICYALLKLSSLHYYLESNNQRQSREIL